MKKDNMYKVIGVVCVCAFVIIGLMLLLNPNKDGNVVLSSESDIYDMFDEVYKNVGVEMPALEANSVDLSNDAGVLSYTGLSDNSDVELIVVSEPLMSSQAYSFVAVKLKDGANIESIKQEMYDNLNMSKWLCVSADELYITNYGNTIVYVMAASDWAEPVYKSFKNYVGKVGKELTKELSDDYELPPEFIVE